MRKILLLSGIAVLTSAKKHQCQILHGVDWGRFTVTVPLHVRVEALGSLVRGVLGSCQDQ